jgi:Fe-Mn family superoxide dismutase
MSKILKTLKETALEPNAIVPNNQIRSLITLIEDQEKNHLELTPLAFKPSDLEPVLSEQNVKFHHGVLARGYVGRFNAGEGDAEFNQAGAYLHNIFFTQLRPVSGSNKPQGAIAALIDEKFGSFAEFQEQFASEAMKIQGSGWVYLTRSGAIRVIANHRIRRDIAMLVDWWEHAFQLDYQNDKQKYLKNFWKIIDWNVVNGRL